jgi:hypothetical protein
MGRRRGSGLGQNVSPLRAARLARNLTLEQVVADLDLQSRGGASGVTVGMLSGWELGRHVTSVRYRQVLCDYYGQSSGVLFAHQDQVLTSSSEAPQLLAGYEDLVAALLAVVRGAEEYLVVMGSRSRDVPYLTAIEEQLQRRPRLVHYRVLFGHPRHLVLKEHMLRLLEIRDPEDRSHGVKTLHLGIVDDIAVMPERFLCASEQAAVLPIASLTSAAAYDSGVRLGPRAAERLIDHTRQCYAASRTIETVEAVHELVVVRPQRLPLDQPVIERSR